MKLENSIRENVKSLKPYSSARDEYSNFSGVFMDANENPYENGVNRYPDPYQKKLKSVISNLKGINPSNIFLGNGSDEVLDLLYRVFCEPSKDNVVFMSPSYGMYKVLADVNNITYREVSYNENFDVDVNELVEQVDVNTKMIVLCSPNNPTGKLIREEVITKIIELTDCLVVVDEAYIDFSNKESWTKKLDKYPQLIVVQTLSKYYGMAGLRVGICYATVEIVNVLNKIKPPYNLNTLTQQKAIELLQNSSENYINEVIRERNKIKLVLEKLPYVVKVYSSDANFLLVKTIDGDKIYQNLLERKIIVRNRTKEPLCENCLRISIGTPEENELLIEALKQI